MANLHQSAQKPDWFDTWFNRPSEYATLQIPEAHATVFEEAIIDLFSATPLWGQMMEVRAILERQVAEPERWVHIPGWHLVHHLKLMSDINFGVDRFLPARHQRMPLQDRRALYLGYFLVKGLTMLDENQAEDFGIPELAAKLAPAERPVLAASQVLWHLVALPHITDEIMRRQKKSAGRGAGVDAGLLAMLDELGEPADNQWRSLFNTPPDAIVARLVKRFHREDRGTGLTSSQLYETARKLQQDRGAGELLARALEMEVEHYTTAVRNDLRTAHRQTEKTSAGVSIRECPFCYAEVNVKQTTICHQCNTAFRIAPEKMGNYEIRKSDEEREAVDTFRLAIRIQDLPYDTPAERGAAVRATLRQVIKDPKTDTTLCRLATLLLQNPAQSNTVLAHRLGIKSPKTVRALKTKLREMLPS
jgi:hypothetical protein